jgi:hypothetical protein
MTNPYSLGLWGFLLIRQEKKKNKDNLEQLENLENQK